MISKSSIMELSETREILVQEEDFVYVLPCEKLRSFISNFTVTFPNRSIISDDYTVLPHGSVTLVLFYYNDELHSFLFGPATKSVKVGSLANQCDIIFIIEFQPAGFFPFHKVNQNELTDRIVPFSLMDYSLDTAMRNVLCDSSTVDELLIKMEQKLLQSIRFQFPKELVSAIQTIIQMEGNMKSAEVAENAFYCSRHLNRLFHRYVGMSVKSFSRLVRVNRAIRMLNEKTNTLDVICEKLGYYDVSHFVKDFRIVCNIAPQGYRNSMSDFYSEIAKF